MRHEKIIKIRVPRFVLKMANTKEGLDRRKKKSALDIKSFVINREAKLLSIKFCRIHIYEVTNPQHEEIGKKNSKLHAFLRFVYNFIL